jgi:hypothetical protein
MLDADVILLRHPKQSSDFWEIKGLDQTQQFLKTITVKEEFTVRVIK